MMPGFVKSEMTAGNRFAMPFLLETDDAAARIGRAIVAQRAELWFPWQMGLAPPSILVVPEAQRALSSRARSVGAGRIRSSCAAQDCGVLFLNK
jgi:hypothetical protein